MNDSAGHLFIRLQRFETRLVDGRSDPFLVDRVKIDQGPNGIRFLPEWHEDKAQGTLHGFHFSCLALESLGLEL